MHASMHAQSHAFYTAPSHLSNNDYSTRCVIILRFIYIFRVSYTLCYFLSVVSLHTIWCLVHLCTRYWFEIVFVFCVMYCNGKH